MNAGHPALIAFWNARADLIEAKLAENTSEEQIKRDIRDLDRTLDRAVAMVKTRQRRRNDLY